MVMPIEPGPNLQAGTAETLFDLAGYYISTNVRRWDVSSDGQRFLMIRQPGATAEANSQSGIILVQNWFTELQRLVPTP